MTQATKKKHVTREVVDNYEFPEENQEIVQVCVSDSFFGKTYFNVFILSIRYFEVVATIYMK